MTHQPTHSANHTCARDSNCAWKTKYEKEFVLTQQLDISKLEEHGIFFKDAGRHFNVDWSGSFFKKPTHLGLIFGCWASCQKNELIIEAKIALKLISSNGNRIEKIFDRNFHVLHAIVSPIRDDEIFIWEDLMNNYFVDGMLTAEVHVKIIKIDGLHKHKNIFFDKQREGDVALIVQDEKFYVDKLYLCSHSSYFGNLIRGKFKESAQPEIVLSNVKAEDFQNFLEVICGADPIDDGTVEGVLQIADMYISPTAQRRCEEFLMKKSEKSLKEKLEMCGKYNSQRGKKFFLSKIKTVKDIESVLPGNLAQMDHSIMTAILQKSMQLHKQNNDA